MSTRLYPLTRQVPKPIVPVAGEPISGHVMRWLSTYGYDEVAMNVFYLADMVEETFGDGQRYGVKLHYLRERKLTGSAGALKQMEGWFDSTFVVVGCDDLTTADLTSLVQFHKERGALATIGLVEAEEVDQYGVVLLDESDRVTGFQEKPAKGTESSKLANTGIYVFEPAIFDQIPANTFYDFGKQVFPRLLRDGQPFYGRQVGGAYWCDIGTPVEYRRATEDVLSGRVQIEGMRQTGFPTGVQIPHDALIEGIVRIGEDVEFGAGVRIFGPTVIGDGVRIGEGVALERAIIWNGSTIGAGAALRDTIVGERYSVEEGASLDGVIVANEEPSEVGRRA